MTEKASSRESCNPYSRSSSQQYEIFKDDQGRLVQGRRKHKHTLRPAGYSVKDAGKPYVGKSISSLDVASKFTGSGTSGVIPISYAKTTQSKV